MTEDRVAPRTAAQPCVFPTGLGELPYYCETHGDIRDRLEQDACRTVRARIEAEATSLDSDELRKALSEWEAIKGSDLADQFRAFIAAGKMADAIRALLSAGDKAEAPE